MRFCLTQSLENTLLSICCDYLCGIYDEIIEEEHDKLELLAL